MWPAHTSRGRSRSRRSPETRPDVLLELGTAELSAGVADATEHLQEAHALAQDDQRALDVVVPLSYALYSRARVYDAAALLDRTIEALGPEDAALAQGLEAQVIAWARFDERLYPMARERLARSAPEADAESDGGRFLLALAASELARAGESPDEARDLAERALTDGLSRGEANWQRYMLSVAVLVTLDDVDAAVARFDDWLEDARRQGSLFAFSHASSFRGLAMLHRGELREAEADARAACEGVPLLRWHSFRTWPRRSSSAASSRRPPV